MNTGPASRPRRPTLAGQYVTLVPLDAAAHGQAIYDATSGEQNDELFRYLAFGPFPDAAAHLQALEKMSASEDPMFLAIVDNSSGLAVGHAAFMRIEPVHRVIEVGNILYTPALQRTAGATEAMYLMARHIFDDLGYRRYEWKCDSLNAPSRAAAERYGFRFEGIFRQAIVYKGRSRDTAWFSIVEGEWPAVRDAFERWLDPANFDDHGRQWARLAELRRER
jgi:RimJ/RimL family protein N-acetyltransferase